MNDRELEELLRRYRPAGASAHLRARVIADAVPAGRTWPWVAAAAVLLATTLNLHIAADHVVARAVDIPVDPKEEAVGHLAELLGDGPTARALAEAAITVDTTPKEPANGAVGRAVASPND
jgi:hypothetical protein